MKKNGYFSLVKVGGVHWLRSPEGRLMFYPAVQCVSPVHGSRVKGAPSYDGIKACGGSLHAWILQTERRLKDWGMKGLGAWNHPLWKYRSVPFTESLNIAKSLNVKDGLKPFFDRDYESQADALVRPQIGRLRDCPALIGWFLDNEIPWQGGWLFRYFDNRPANDPNRRAVLAFLRRRYGSIGALNRAWGTGLSGWGALARARRLPATRDAAGGDMEAFLGVCARRFFEISCRLVRRYDRHRPILGVRYAGFPSSMAVIAAQKGLTDAVSINLYMQEGVFPGEKMAEANRLSGDQPLWITEFSWHAPWDNRSGDRNKCGFGSRVRRQESRGKAYANFIGGASRTPFVVGCDWFQWPDESPMGRGDGEDVNFGLVDIRNRPYRELVAAVTRTNLAADRLHAASAAWKPPREPRQAVPVAALTPGADSTVLEGMRWRPGPDPKPARVPVEVRAGWVPGALMVSAMVGDSRRTIEVERTKRSIEWFWMTDAVEILARADRPGGEVPAVFDVHSVKVWGIPDGAGRGRPFVGAYLRHRRVWGGRTGVRVRQRAVRGGYRLDFTVPARVLGLKRIEPGTTMRFNVLVMDCEKVLEACWSDHSGNWTTERPGGWGKMTAVL